MRHRTFRPGAARLDRETGRVLSTRVERHGRLPPAARRTPRAPAAAPPGCPPPSGRAHRSARQRLAELGQAVLHLGRRRRPHRAARRARRAPASAASPSACAARCLRSGAAQRVEAQRRRLQDEDDQRCSRCRRPGPARRGSGRCRRRPASKPGLACSSGADWRASADVHAVLSR